MPTPGPMAGRPYPIMFAEPVTMIPFGLFLLVSRVVLGWCRAVLECSGRSSVLVCQRAGDVHGVEQDEDVGLEELHQQLEEGDRDEQQPGEDADRLDETGTVQQQVLATDREQQHQE